MKKFALVKKQSNVTKFKLNIKLEKEITGDIWDYVGKANIICFGTNNFISINGKNVMGAGLAKEVLNKFPNIDYELGDLIHRFGAGPFIIKNIDGTKIISFPVKPDYIICNKNKSNIVTHARNKYNFGDKVPGFHAKADLEIIRKSAHSLKNISDRWYKANLLKRVILPKPGCGMGELNWNDVKKTLMDVGLYQMEYLQIISQ